MKNLNQYLLNAKNTIGQYPMVLLSASVTAFCIIIFITQYSLPYEQIEKEYMFFLSKIALTGSWGISVFFALQNTAQRFGQSLGLNILGVGLLLFFYFGLLPESTEDIVRDKDIIYTIYVGISFVLSHLAVAFFPFIGMKDKEIHFWEYNKNLFANISLAYIFTLVLMGGISLAFLAISALFDITIDGYFYLQTNAFLAILVGCFIFLSFCKNLSQLENPEQKYPIVIKFFTQFILIPLLIIYGIILYLYGLRILISWELPKGWISFMIMAYSIVGLLAFLLVYPLGKSNAKSWVKFFFRIFFFSLLPLLVLLFVAIFTRILEYGFTENRYFVFLFAVWLSFIVFYFIIIKQSSIRIIPISLFYFALASITLPYLNTFSVSKMSQKMQLEDLLHESNLLENGKINFNKSITRLQQHLIAEKMAFLEVRNEQQYLLSFVAPQERPNFQEILMNDYPSSYDFELLFTNVVSPKGERNTDIAEIAPIEIITFSPSIDIPKNYPYMILFNAATSQEIGEKDSIFISNDDRHFALQSGEERYYYNLEEQIKTLIKNQQIKNEMPSPPIAFSLGKYDFVIILKQISYEKDEDNHPISNIDYNNELIIFYKPKK